MRSPEPWLSLFSLDLMLRRFVLSIVGAALLCAAITFANEHYLRYSARPFLGDAYEVFVYSIAEIGPFAFFTAAFTLYHLLNRSRPRNAFTTAAIISGGLAFALSIAADVLFMPRVRFP